MTKLSDEVSKERLQQLYLVDGLSTIHWRSGSVPTESRPDGYFSSTTPRSGRAPTPASEGDHPCSIL